MNKKYKYGIVILQYNTYNLTRDSISYLMQLDHIEDAAIVIVDNASTDGSDRQLSVMINDMANVSADDDHTNDTSSQDNSSRSVIEVICNSENAGFARGNNLGYDFLKKNYDPDFIIVMNNDVMVHQQDFLTRIAELYEDEGYAVLGPDIVTPQDGFHNNPLRYEAMTMADCEKRRKWLSMVTRFPFLFYLRSALGYKVLKNHGVAQKISDRKGVPYQKQSAGVVLQGACFIFSRDFIDNRSYAFCPDTFLFYEEDILWLECQDAGLKMLYSPDISVEHREKSSTSTLGRNGYLRYRKIQSISYDSIQVLIDKLKEYGKA